MDNIKQTITWTHSSKLLKDGMLKFDKDWKITNNNQRAFYVVYLAGPMVNQSYGCEDYILHKVYETELAQEGSIRKQSQDLKNMSHVLNNEQFDMFSHGSTPLLNSRLDENNDCHYLFLKVWNDQLKQYITSYTLSFTVHDEKTVGGSSLLKFTGPGLVKWMNSDPTPKFVLWYLHVMLASQLGIKQDGLFISKL